jgi:hypothetical protein
MGKQANWNAEKKMKITKLGRSWKGVKQLAVSNKKGYREIK